MDTLRWFWNRSISPASTRKTRPRRFVVQIQYFLGISCGIQSLLINSNGAKIALSFGTHIVKSVLGSIEQLVIQLSNTSMNHSIDVNIPPLKLNPLAFHSNCTDSYVCKLST